MRICRQCAQNARRLKVGRRKAQPEDCRKNSLQLVGVSILSGPVESNFPAGFSVTLRARSANISRKSVDPSCAALRRSSWLRKRAFATLEIMEVKSDFRAGAAEFTSCTAFVLNSCDFRAGATEVYSYFSAAFL